jgi:hypothetical protein
MFQVSALFWKLKLKPDDAFLFFGPFFFGLLGFCNFFCRIVICEYLPQSKMLHQRLDYLAGGAAGEPGLKKFNPDDWLHNVVNSNVKHPANKDKALPCLG